MSSIIVGMIESDIEDSTDSLEPAEVALEGAPLDTTRDYHPIERQ